MTIHRKPRIPLKLQVVYDDGASFMSGSAIDMSETGLFIETVMPLEPGTTVRLMPLVPGDDSSVLEIEGQVMRKAEYDLDNHFDRTPGMGIRFTSLTGEQRVAIAGLLQRGRSNPST